jgi:DUF1680 family protein
MNSSISKLNQIPLTQVKINDEFWSKYIRLVNDVVLPYQWDALNDNIPDTEPSHSIKNFRIAAGLESGEFYGMVFQDSDVAKWIEAVAYSLAVKPNPQMEHIIDEIIDVFEKAQQEDGYLNTYFIIKEPSKRWTNLRECHELYCAGHLIEAAVAYYRATGKKKFLDIMCRYADYIYTVFGTEPGKLHGYDGHQEIELALIKLYKATGHERYLELSKYFIDERGKEPYFFDAESDKRGNTVFFTEHPTHSRTYNQTHLPVREQKTVEGHAVRAVYMLTAMAGIASETGDKELFSACRRLWNNMVSKRMYVTGAIGSAAYGEAFTCDYDLPNDSAYAETCASVGLIFFAHKMLELELDGKYADEIERALYNVVLASMSLDGKRFFYVNPLEVWPEACNNNPTLKHVKTERQKWFGCSCCPPNVARLLMSLGQYIYGTDETTIYTHLYIGGEASVNVGENQIKLKQDTKYPWDGKTVITLSAAKEQRFSLALRIPGWCQKAEIFVNGNPIDLTGLIRNGYAFIDRTWSNGDTVELQLEMTIQFLHANPKVRADAGKVAIQRGPMVYCIEEKDNGSNIPGITLQTEAAASTVFNQALLGGTQIINVSAYRQTDTGWEDSRLYRAFDSGRQQINVTAIPYCLWGNRGTGEMQVWIKYR